jgi:hypothetical protein
LWGWACAIEPDPAKAKVTRAEAMRRIRLFR